MFRPNRIGSHVLVDTSAGLDEIPITTANFATTCAANPAMDVQTDNATVKDQQSVAFEKDASETWSIPAGESFSFGRFVSGSDPSDPDRPFQINIAGSLYVDFAGTALENLDIGFYIGRLTTGTPGVDHTGLVNDMSGMCRLPCQVREASRDQYECDIMLSVINGLFDGAVTTLSTQAVGVFWNIRNTALAGRSITDLRGHLSVYKYTGDINTLDPNR